MKSKIRKIIIIAVMVVVFCLCLIEPKNYNSKYKLNLYSSYGDKEAYHPKILNFKDKWNGYKYWMSFTPYPQGDDSKENPHIVASNDLINWEVPKGLINPLDTPKETISMQRYNSDSHIVYNDNLDRIECYWRYVDDVLDRAIMYRMYSYDGVNWSKREISLLTKPRSEWDCVSPAIIFEDNIYKMWYINKHNTLTYSESKDGLKWKLHKVIPIKYEDKTKTWHLDVIKTELGYEMISVAYDWWDNHNDMNLYYSKSKDGFNWDTFKTILKPARNTAHWDNRGIYRSSFMYEDGVYYLYYSGTSLDLHHGVGFMYGKDIYKLNKVNTNFSNKKEVNKLIEKLNDYKS